MTTKAEATLSLLELGARLTRIQTEELQDLAEPLSLRQYRILARVSVGVSSVTELARMAQRTMSTISRSVDSLIQRGLLSRTPSPVDARTQVLQLTPAGQTALKDARRALSELVTWVESFLSESDAELVSRISSELYSQAGQRMGVAPLDTPGAVPSDLIGVRRIAGTGD